MRLQDSVIRAFQELELDKAEILKTRNKVKITHYGGETSIGRVTKSPYFEVGHILHGSFSNGGWWVQIDGRTYSLRDYNVIPNSYNNHKIELIEEYNPN